ncbi:MAG: D-cysteine desulfhydrase family protein [Candidatus Aminicenantes bacterium]|nr:D-cysteine desulfhydrase family protein [Candidatus Aminicenantes bacterium]
MDNKKSSGIEELRRVALISRPTPMVKMDNLTEALGGPEIYIKRDDLTGLAFGGNKSRKLEYIIQDVLDKRADVVITWAGIQSNWCLQTAAAARKYGLKPILLLFRTAEHTGEIDGNVLLDVILEADIRFCETKGGRVVTEEEAEDAVQKVVNEVLEKGHRPYIVPIGGSVVGGSMDKPLGAVGYFDAFNEIKNQAGKKGLKIDYIIHASGSGSTQAGLLLGAKADGTGIRIFGVSVSEEKETFSESILKIARDAEDAWGLKTSVTDEDIVVYDEYIGEGYGFMNKNVADTLRFVALHEGLYLDPVYTGKAMAGLVDLIKKGTFKKSDRIVFLHTGGVPALFPYRNIIVDYLSYK